MLTPRADNDDVWPALPYADWKNTCTTLHMWTQIVGKVKLELTPFLNEWWNVTFAVTARGLTTSTIPFAQRMFQVDFDFIDHRLMIHVSDGHSRSMRLVARFGGRFLYGVHGQLGVSRHPGEDQYARWMELGADHEQALAGFWPGNDKLAEPAFVAYMYPEPPGCRTASISPDAAFFHPELAEFILPYEKVRLAANPDQLILDFYRSTYEIGATLAGWDRAALERADPQRQVDDSSGTAGQRPQSPEAEGATER